MNYTWDFASLLQYRWVLLTGLEFTLGLTVASTVLGLALGTGIALLRLTRNRFLNAVVYVLTEIFRCTPMLVQLIWFYYALPILIGVSMSATTASLLTLTLYGASFYAEVVRGGIRAIEPGQWDAANALGIGRTRIMRHLILPQAVRVMLPALLNQTILQLKNSSLVSTLAVPDLVYQAEQVTAATFRPLEVYSMVAVVYFAVLFPVTLGVRVLEGRLARHA